MIDLSFLWFIPIRPPVRALRLQRIVMIGVIREDFIRKHIIDRGASFCHVLKMRQLVHDREHITEGNQK
jgi:hypothetical protein